MAAAKVGVTASMSPAASRTEELGDGVPRCGVSSLGDDFAETAPHTPRQVRKSPELVGEGIFHLVSECFERLGLREQWCNVRNGCAGIDVLAASGAEEGASSEADDVVYDVAVRAGEHILIGSACRQRRPSDRRQQDPLVPPVSSER